MVLAGAGGRAGAAVRGLLGDRADAGRRASSRRSSCWLLIVGVGRLSLGAGRGGRGGPAVRLAGRACRPARRLAAVHGRRALRDPRHQLQPGHVPAPAGGRSPRRRPASQLLHQGYPLGPHAIVVALNKGLGIGLVQGFSGLTIAVAVLAPLTALAAFAELPLAAAHRRRPSSSASPTWSPPTSPRAPSRRRCRRCSCSPSSSPCGRADPRLGRSAAPLRPGGADRGRLVYTYSFPGLIWLGRRRRSIWAGCLSAARCPGAPRRSPLVVFLVGALPRARPHGRLPQLRDLRPQRPRASATSSVRSRPSRRWGSGPRATSASRPGTVRCRRSATTSAPLSRSSSSLYGLVRCWRGRERAILAGARRRGARLCRGPGRRHPLHRRQGDRDRRAARRPDDPPAAAVDVAWSCIRPGDRKGTDRSGGVA